MYVNDSSFKVMQAAVRSFNECSRNIWLWHTEDIEPAQCQAIFFKGFQHQRDGLGISVLKPTKHQFCE